MNKKKRLLFVIYLLALFFSCKEDSFMYISEEEAQDTINVDYDFLYREDSLFFSQIIDSINYIPIPTSDDFLIGEISRFFVVDSMFLILDKKITHSLFAFSKSKKYKRQINAHGSGPSEYLNPCYVLYDAEKEEFGVYCNIKQELYYYGKDCEYKYKLKVPYKSYAVYPIGDKILMHSEYHDNEQLEKNEMFPNLILANQCGGENVQGVNYFAGNVNQTIVWTSNSNISFWGDTLSIKPDHSNIVYYCTKDTIYPAILIDLGTSNIDNRYWKKVFEPNMTLKKMDEYCRSQNLYEIYRFLENKKFIYFLIRVNKRMFHVLYSKDTRKKYVFNSLVNDLDELAAFDPKAICENKLYCVLPAYIVARIRDSVNTEIGDLKLLDVKSTDNPVVVELSLKNF